VPVPRVDQHPIHVENDGFDHRLASSTRGTNCRWRLPDDRCSVEGVRARTRHGRPALPHRPVRTPVQFGRDQRHLVCGNQIPRYHLSLLPVLAEAVDPDTARPVGRTRMRLHLAQAGEGGQSGPHVLQGVRHALSNTKLDERRLTQEVPDGRGLARRIFTLMASGVCGPTSWCRVTGRESWVGGHPADRAKSPTRAADRAHRSRSRIQPRRTAGKATACSSVGRRKSRDDLRFAWDPGDHIIRRPSRGHGFVRAHHHEPRRHAWSGANSFEDPSSRLRVRSSWDSEPSVCADRIVADVVAIRLVSE